MKRDECDKRTTKLVADTAHQVQRLQKSFRNGTLV